MQNTLSEAVAIDGSQGEGGGQILRTSLALAMVTGRPLAMERIRAGRPKPGLMRQHLACVQAAAGVCGGAAEGAEPGSTALRFTPGPVRAGNYHFPVAGAGSCLLVLQTVLPALMLADGDSRLQLSGGTHNPMAPPFDFLQNAFAPLLARLGVGLELQLLRRGFHPAGGGQVQATVRPAAALAPVDLPEPGPLQDAWAEALAPGLPRRIPARELEAIGRHLGWTHERGQLRQAVARQNEGPGNALLAILRHQELTEVFCGFGQPGISSEQVAARVARTVQAYQTSGAALGPYLADQWMLPLALAVWRSGRPASYTASAWSPRSATNAAVIARWLPVTVESHPDCGGRRVRVGLQPRAL
ncbi:RNA 3'-terminal phosphate cyclase [Comamonas humi]